MRCKVKPPPSETLTCGTCATPWHLSCLTEAPSSASDSHWDCPDCSDLFSDQPVAPSGNAIPSAVLAIQADPSLSEQEKARRCQEILCGSSDLARNQTATNDDDVFDASLTCVVCFNPLDRPISVCSSFFPSLPVLFFYL